MRRTAVKLVAAMLVLAGGWSGAQAGVIFYDNFTNDTAGTYPVNANVQVGAGQTATWTVSNAGPTTDMQVVTDATGNKVFQLNYGGGLAHSAKLVVNNGAGPGDLLAGQSLVLSLKVRYNAWTSPDKMAYNAWGKRSSLATNTISIVYNDATLTNQLSYTTGGTSTGIGPVATNPIVLGRWYLIKQVFTSDSNTFTVSIQDLTTGTTFSAGPINLPTAGQGYSKIYGFMFDPANTAKSAHMDLDELKLEIVDPKVATPTFSPDGGTSIQGCTVSMSCATSGATIRYTTDGSEPLDNSTAYSVPVAVNSTMTLKAKAFATGNDPSDTKIALYTVSHATTIYYANFDNDTVGQNPSGANVQAAPGMTATWDILKPATYPDDIKVVDDGTGNKVLRMDYVARDYERAKLTVDGGVALADLTAGQALVGSFKVRFNGWSVPDKMGYLGMGTVAGGPVKGAVMYNDASNSYVMTSGAQALLQGKTLVVGRWYQVKQTYLLDNNTFIGTITDLVTGDTSSNGTPQAMYTAGLVKMVGISFDPESNTKSAHLDIDEVKLEIVNPPAAMPTFSPDGGAFIQGRMVTMNCATPGATIRYTTDGSEPLDNSTAYLTPILVDSTMTLKAKAFATGYSASDIKIALYTISHAATILYSNFESDNVDQNPNSANVQVAAGMTATWAVTKPAGYPDDIKVVDDGTGNKVLRMNYPKGDWERAWLTVDQGVYPQDLTAGQKLVASFKVRYNSWQSPVDPGNTDKMGYLGFGKDAGGSQKTGPVLASDSANQYVIVSGLQALMPTKTLVVGRWYQVKVTYDLINPDNFTFIGTMTDLVTGDTGSNSVPQTMRNAGIVKFTGIGIDPESNAKSANLDIDEVKLEIVSPATATPTFSLGGGSYAGSQAVTISCATDNATIRYTIDGTDPIDNSSLYTGPVLVDHTLTLKAKAWSSNPASDVASVYYVLARPAPIPNGSVTVDGNLSDWSDATWAPLDQAYFQTTSDIAQAYYAAKWTAGTLYVAVKVQDNNQNLATAWGPWNAADSVEIYLHTTGSYADNHTDYSADQAAAQQYVLGVRSDNTNAVWSVVGAGNPILPAYGFSAAGKKNLSWLQYEAAITPYQTFNVSGTGLVTSPLSAGQAIGLDVVANSRFGVGDANFGSKSENLLASKYSDYRQIALHQLGPRTVFTSADLSAVLAAMDSKTGGPGWNASSDFDNDGEITSSDLAIVLAGLQ